MIFTAEAVRGHPGSLSGIKNTPDARMGLVQKGKKGTVDMEKYYGVLSAEPSELELENRALARAAAAEGFVLLKNEGALPLTSDKVALYGMGARKTVKGGLGSGSVEERYSVNIEDGLKNAGLEVTTQSWLDDYDAQYSEEYAAYHDMVEDEIKDLTNPMQIIPVAHSYVFRYPSGRLITADDVRESDTDTALYVIMRQAGEGNDRKLEAGDYYITETERKNLEIVAREYAHTVLIINVGGHIDLSFMDEIAGIDAVLLFVQGGEEGGNALADVLTGKMNFSGKLADTIPMKYEDIPFGDEFSYLSGDLDNAYYKEGIYVGYRYFDSFGVPVRYPFGFGLSYTQFDIETKSVTAEGSKVTASVCVTNTGDCAGKEVVQLYVSAPAGKQAREYQSLAAFSKTCELEPGKSQTLELSFDLADCAAYREEYACWYLDEGSYILRIGNSSRDTRPAAVIELDNTVVTLICRNCCTPSDELPVFVPETAASSGCLCDVPKITVSAKSFTTRTVDYTEPAVRETEQEKAILDSLSLDEMCELLKGGDLQRSPEGSFEIHGAAGKTATTLMDKGLMDIIMSDGPAGVNVVDEVYTLPGGKFVPAKVPERYNWGMLGKGMAAKLGQIKAPKVYRYATAWPVEMLLAQTWNAPLLEQIGKAVAGEMQAFGVSVWLSPGMNIHRNPLGGRTFEYYSEDPVLSGKIAASLTRGVQSVGGSQACVKHFCCNNIEDNRNGMSVNISERALREIYLKGFEIAVKESKPKTLMTSYNQVNHVYTANSHDLLTDILRCEWGFDGLVMTDWNSCNEKAGRSELCPVAGNDIIMPGSDHDKKCLLEALGNGTVSAGQVRTCASRVLRMILNGNTPGLTEK